MLNSELSTPIQKQQQSQLNRTPYISIDLLQTFSNVNELLPVQAARDYHNYHAATTIIHLITVCFS